MATIANEIVTHIREEDIGGSVVIDYKIKENLNEAVKVFVRGWVPQYMEPTYSQMAQTLEENSTYGVEV